jgi:tetratricopeptide (TPR) repeat protein
MLTNKRILAAAIACSLALTAPLLAPSYARAADDGEQQDRAVDEAALASQKDAVNELTNMLAKYRNTPREADFLERLADIQQQSAMMEFRVTHGNARRDGKAVNLTHYQEVMGSSIPTLSRLLEKFPSLPSAAHSYYMRGVAYQETLALPSAKKDFIYLTQKFPSAPEVMPAYMALGEFAMDDKKYPEAIQYFSSILRHPDDSHYPHALYKTAWSEYYLSHTRQSLEASETVVRFLRAKGQASSDQGMLENILKDIPVFFFAGYQQQDPNYQVSKALPFFKSLDHDEPYEHMLIEFSNLLRTHDREKDFFTWKDLVIAAEPARAASYEILLQTFDYQLNRMTYADLTKSVGDIVKIYPKFREGDTGKHAQKLLLDASVAIQKLILQQPARKDEYARYLAVIYAGFVQIAGEEDPRIRSIHANLGETYFSIRDFEPAVTHYRWIVAHGSWSDRVGGISGADASLKAIAARYETLRERKLVPGELKAVSRGSGDNVKAPVLITEWVSWIDAYEKQGGQTDNFQFEADRCLYAQGEVNLATDRLHAFALHRPESSFAIPAATLVIDTEIASGNWERLYAVLNEFLRVPAWKNTAFNGRVYTLAADTKLKMAQNYAKSGNSTAALAEADDFVKEYHGNTHLVDALSLAGKSALATKNRARAIGYYGAIAAAAPNTETAAKALLSKANIEEERYSFADAARTYAAYLNLPSAATRVTDPRKNEIRRRVLNYSWLSGDAVLLVQALSNKNICTQSLRDECERDSALVTLAQDRAPTAKSATAAARVAQRSSPAVRAIWAAVALKDPAVLSPALRHQMLHVLASEWKHADELSRFTLLSSISQSVPEVFALDRALLVRSGTLKADPASLTRRLRAIEAVETSASEASTLPWSRIRALVLNDMASIYTDLSSAVRALPYPTRLRSPRDRDGYRRMIEQLVSPFDQKANAIRSEAFRLASRTSIEPEVYGVIARAYFQADLPQQPGTQKTSVPRQKLDASLDMSLVKSVDEHGGWHSVNLDSADTTDILRARWAAALTAKNWPQVGYFAQEAKQKSLLKPEVTGVAKAVSLAAAGAKAEGAMELADVCRAGGGAKLSSACNGLKENL